MMAKPATTKIRLRNKHIGRPPRPDPPLLRHLPPPETRRRRSLRPRRRRQLSEGDAYELDHEEEEEDRSLKKLRLVVKLPRSPNSRPYRPAAVSYASSSSSSPSTSPATSSSSSYANDDELEENADEEEETVMPPKKRRIDRCGDVSSVAIRRSGHHEESKLNAVGRSSGNGSGNLPASWSGTTLPERNELELILHKLQKKDTYGAFSEPVDPEELPDYHDVIEHPMDFGTVRKKLAKGAYRSFEQFEDDVLLICSNAMQYNAPDTIYFRQACAIQDMARKKFQNVRDNVKHTETEQAEHAEQAEQAEQRSREKGGITSTEKMSAITRCAPKTQCKAVVEPLISDISSAATFTSAGDTSTGLSTVNGIEKSVPVNEHLDASSTLEGSKQVKSIPVNRLPDASSSLGESKQKEPLHVNGFLNASSSLREIKQDKSVAVNGLVDGNSALGDSKQDKGDEFSVKSSPSKLGRKPAPVDETRRTTYSITPEQRPMVESDLILSAFEDEQKQLVHVGLDVEHSYARSLARFTASLGPVAWEIVSKKIENALPSGIKFGPGWVGEYEPLPTPFLAVETRRNPQVTNSPKSFSRTAANVKVGELKSRSVKTPRKAAAISVESTSCENSGEQKQRLVGVGSTAQSKINTRNSPTASVRVKEETPCDKIAERRQDVSSQARISNPSKSAQNSFSGIFSSSHAQTEPQKVFRAQNLNNVPEIAVVGSNNGNSLAFISSNQTGVVNYGLRRNNNHDHAASDDHFKLASLSFPGKVSVSHVQQSAPVVVSPLSKEDFSPATSAAARAWMSVGTSGQWKSVDGKSGSEKPPPFCNPSWKPPTSSAQFNGYSMIRPASLPFVEAPQAKNRGLVIFPQLISAEMSKYQNHPSCWQGSSPQAQGKQGKQRQRDNLPPDLNIGYQPPASPIQPSSSLAMDSQQPDLALQL